MIFHASMIVQNDASQAYKTCLFPGKGCLPVTHEKLD